MNEERILNKLAEILRKNGYTVTKRDYAEEDYPAVNEWIENTDLSSRAINALYNGKYPQDIISGAGGKDMLELIADVKSGKILKIHNVGKKTYEEIAHALQITLNIDL